MTNPTLESVQRTLARYGLIPQTLLARFSLALALILGAWTLIGIQRFTAAYRIALLVFTATLLVLGYRVLTQRFMWRLRNRLIVTYVFIGVIPLILLATMGLIAGYLFAGQFSTFVVTTDVRNELSRLESSNRTMTYLAAGVLRRGGELDPNRLAISNEAFPERQITAYYRGGSKVLIGGASGQPSATPPPQVPEAVLIVDQGDLYLRAVSRATLSGSPGDELTLVSSVPLDQPHLESMVPGMGVLTLYGEHSSGQPSSPMETGTYIKVGSTEVDATPKVVCGSLPPPDFRMDIEFAPFVTILNAVHWQSGEPSNLLLSMRTRPSLLYNRLLHSHAGLMSDMTSLILVALVVIAVVFALIEIVAFIIGVRLTRTMTSSVAKLYEATQHVNRGEFSHRIQVHSHDQLASLEASFNSMAESLQKLIAEQEEKQRIESELSIAKEVQDMLFPRDAADLDGLELHGICRPARTVSGDYYDFLPVGPNTVGLAVGDISGKGISAALMMATVHAFIRAHTLLEQVPAMVAAQGSVAPIVLSENRSCCPSPGTVLAQLNQQLYRSTPAQKYATMFLGFYDQQTRQLTYSTAGQLPPMVICANGSPRLLDVGGTVVGLFGDMVYPEGRITLDPGDIVIAFSDGITEPENDFGEFGEERLREIVLENRDLPLARISDAILNAVIDWIGGEEQPDDMTVVLARAR
jgi:sigma-B regulation protein RsbU (phosphoserine phosphatase)